MAATGRLRVYVDDREVTDPATITWVSDQYVQIHRTIHGDTIRVEVEPVEDGD